jgi:hypothetical protein
MRLVLPASMLILLVERHQQGTLVIPAGFGILGLTHDRFLRVGFSSTGNHMDTAVHSEEPDILTIV